VIVAKRIYQLDLTKGKQDSALFKHFVTKILPGSLS